MFVNFVCVKLKKKIFRSLKFSNFIQISKWPRSKTVRDCIVWFYKIFLWRRLRSWLIKIRIKINFLLMHRIHTWYYVRMINLFQLFLPNLKTKNLSLMWTKNINCFFSVNSKYLNKIFFVKLKKSVKNT